MTQQGVAESERLVPGALPGRVILEFPKLKTEKKDEGGKTLLYLLPESTAGADDDTDTSVATVISVGDGTDKAEEMFARIVKPGMKVIADKVVGTPFTIGKGDDRREYFIFRTFEIIGIAQAAS